SIRVRKCASLLRPCGTLAIVNTHWAAGERDSRFARESQACYARWDPGYDPSFRLEGPEDLPQCNEELEEPGIFDEIALRRYFYDREHSARTYCDLLGTFSNVRAFDELDRQGFLTCIFELITGQFGGHITRRDVYDLWLARIPYEGRR